MLFYAQYDCIYSAKGIASDLFGNKKKVDIPLDHYACFGSIYDEIRSSTYAEIEYKVYLYRDNLPNKNFNLCTKLEVKKILRSLRKVVDFSYKFTKATYCISKFDKKTVYFNVLVINVKGNFAQHVWLTSMLRCFFEWPYNVAAKEACALQAEYKNIEGIDISRVNWVNLYLTVASKTGSTRLHGIVDSERQPLAYTYNEWRDLLSKLQPNVLIIQSIKSKHRYKDDFEFILKEDEYNKGIQNRASKYVLAYKDKISWRKK